MRNLERRIERGLCTGCGLCVDSPAEMKINVLGYLRPINPINDQTTNNCCPAIRVDNFAKNVTYHPVWGPIKGCNQGFSTDPHVRTIGSSGGAITQILILLLEKGLVDGVVHIGEDSNAPGENIVSISTSVDQIIRKAGSRYSPSAPLSLIRGLIGDNKKYAIAAKPCDISAMRALVETNEQAKSQFKYLLSFFCAGIPSQIGTSKVLEALNVEPEELQSLKYRGDGWPGLTTATLRDGSTRTMTYNQAWGTILNRHLQNRCKLCADGIGEAADFVCADAWEESEDGYPKFEERDGFSLIITRTDVGADLLNLALADKKIEVRNFEIDRLTKIQEYQFQRKATSLARNSAYFLTNFFGLRFIGYRLSDVSRIVSLKTQLRIFLGSAKRFARKKIDSM